MKTAFIITMLILFSVMFAIRMLRIFDTNTEWPLTSKTTLPQECGNALMDGLMIIWAALILALS
jgi:UPF0716 family protein affecting phage T7 exclusion